MLLVHRPSVVASVCRVSFAEQNGSTAGKKKHTQSVCSRSVVWLSHSTTHAVSSHPVALSTWLKLTPALPEGVAPPTSSARFEPVCSCVFCSLQRLLPVSSDPVPSQDFDVAGTRLQGQPPPTPPTPPLWLLAGAKRLARLPSDGHSCWLLALIRGTNI